MTPPQHGASVGVQSSCGALKHFAWKSKSETFSCVSLTNSHTQRFGLTVSFRRSPSSFYESYTPGHLLDLRSHLVAWDEHDASVGVQSSTGALKHLALKCKSEMFNCVLLINSHTQHDAFAETDPPAALSSIHSPILDSV